MPRLHRETASSVFFLFGRDPRSGEIVGPHGTGTFIGRQSPVAPNFVHWYAVTNRHLACTGSSIIGLNTLDGRRRLIEFDPSEWLFTGDGDDLAAVDMTDHRGINDYVCITHESVLVTQDAIGRFHIGPGEDCFMCGLFVSHHSGSIWADGTPHNIPAFRFGNISMLADMSALVKVPTGALRPCFLVDMRSRTGFSGSPVFIYRTIGSNLTQLAAGWSPDRWKGKPFSVSDPDEMFIGMLGIHCGQFWDTVKAFKTKDRAELIGDSLNDGDELDIQGSMNIVAPAWCITELLDLEVFEMARRKRDERWRQESRRMPQAEGAPSQKVDLPANDANPTHREDFTRLVGAAARKPEPKD